MSNTQQQSTEIVPVVEEVRLGTLSASSPSDVVKRASSVAGELAKVVKDRRLYKAINGKNFVQVEGWTTLGAMLGVLPRERQVTKFEGGWEAYVDLIRASDGVVIGGASAICTRDERNWGKRDEYAVRSMAITRATGKAFRLGFSWIMTLAGYEVTPAEEMPDEWDAKIVEAGEVKPDLPKSEPMPYDIARGIQVKVGDDTKTLDKLSPKMLNWFIANTEKPNVKEGATVVLRHDYNMEPAPAQ